MHDAAGCRSYFVDPTLGGETDAAVLDFAAKVAAYGSTLNASVGLGDGGTILDRTGKHHRLVTFHSLLPKGWRRLSLIKLDVEGAEFTSLLHPRDGLLQLCAEGALEVDQLVVEIHATASVRPTLGTLHTVFSGAARCGLMLHHKEKTQKTRHRLSNRGGLVEFSWASIQHVARLVGSQHSVSESLISAVS